MCNFYMLSITIASINLQCYFVLFSFMCEFGVWIQSKKAHCPLNHQKLSFVSHIYIYIYIYVYIVNVFSKI